MRIEYYNSNNEMTSKKEYKTNIPKCVKKFIDARPLVNINMEEYKLLKSKKNKTKRDFLIDKLKYYLKFDYSLFLQSEKCHRPMKDYVFHILQSLFGKHSLSWLYLVLK